MYTCEICMQISIFSPFVFWSFRGWALFCVFNFFFRLFYVYL